MVDDRSEVSAPVAVDPGGPFGINIASQKLLSIWVTSSRIIGQLPLWMETDGKLGSVLAGT